MALDVDRREQVFGFGQNCIFGSVFEPGLRVSRALVDRGIPNVRAPIPAHGGVLGAPVTGSEDWTVVLYPFVEGRSAKVVGLDAAQWRIFGAALGAVNGSDLGAVFRDELRVEDFALPVGAVVRRLLTELESATFASPAAASFAGYWHGDTDHIQAVLARTEALGRELQDRHFDVVLYHGDIHLINLIVDNIGGVWLVDWDGPLIAPRERDLLFVVGPRIGRRPTPREEDHFFEGYGATDIDPVALAYYRYERRLEDLGEIGSRVFHDPRLSEAMRGQEAAAAIKSFAPDGDFAVAALVSRNRWPIETRDKSTKEPPR